MIIWFRPRWPLPNPVAVIGGLLLWSGVPALSANPNAATPAASSTTEADPATGPASAPAQGTDAALHSEVTEQSSILSTDAAIVLLTALQDEDTDVSDQAWSTLTEARLPINSQVSGLMLQLATRIGPPSRQLWLFERVEALLTDDLNEATPAEAIEAVGKHPMVLLHRGVAQYGMTMVTGGTQAEVSAGLQTAAATLDRLVRLTDWPVEDDEEQAELAELKLQAAFWAGNAYESLGSLHWGHDMAEARRWYALFRQRATYQAQHGNHDDDDPNRGRARLWLASLKYADAAWHAGEQAAALPIYAAVGRELERVAEEDRKQNVDWHEAAAALGAASVVVAGENLAREQWDAAESWYEAARTWCRSFAQVPRFAPIAATMEVANAFPVPTLALLRGDPEDALNALDDVRRLLRELATAEGIDGIARFDDRPAQAYASQFEAVIRLLANAPETANIESQRQLANAWRGLGLKALELGENAAAYAFLKRSRELLAPMADAHPATAGEDLFFADGQLSMAAYRIGRRDESERRLAHTLARGTALVQATHPNAAEIRRTSLQYLVMLAELAAVRGDDERREHYRSQALQQAAALQDMQLIAPEQRGMVERQLADRGDGISSTPVQLDLRLRPGGVSDAGVRFSRGNWTLGFSHNLSP